MILRVAMPVLKNCSSSSLFFTTDLCSWLYLLKCCALQSSLLNYMLLLMSLPTFAHVTLHSSLVLPMCLQSIPPRCLPANAIFICSSPVSTSITKTPITNDCRMVLYRPSLQILPIWKWLTGNYRSTWCFITAIFPLICLWTNLFVTVTVISTLSTESVPEFLKDLASLFHSKCYKLTTASATVLN